MAENENSPLLPENPTCEQMAEFFSKDAYATDRTGCKMLESRAGHAMAELELNPSWHYNAQGYMMGGVAFTLADFALAGASVCGKHASVSLSSTIEFMKSPKGKKLIATCDADRQGNKVGFFTVKIEDELGTPVALLVSSCYYPA